MEINALKKALEEEKKAFENLSETTESLKRQLEEKFEKTSSSFFKKIVYRDKRKSLQGNISRLNMELLCSNAKKEAIDKFLNSVTEDGLIFPVGLYETLFCLQLVNTNTFSIEYLSSVFGFIVKEMNLFTSMGAFKDFETDEISNLSSYFQKNGAFVYHDDSDSFWGYMNDILEKVDEEEPLGAKEVMWDVDDLSTEICKLYESFVDNYQKNLINVSSSVQNNLSNKNVNSFLLLESKDSCCLLDDILSIPKGLRKNFSYLLEHKLNEDIIRKSPLVMSNEAIKYPIYNVVYKDCSVFVMDIGGVYVLVGASIFGYGENEIKLRIWECAEEINQLLLMLQSDETRSRLLKEHALKIENVKNELSRKKEMTRERK